MRTLAEIESHKRKWLHFGKIFDPNVIIPRLIKILPFLDYLTRTQLDAVDRPNLAYGIYAAAYLAKSLGLPAVSVIEFGVAGGDGLVCMERHAEKLGSEIGIRIDVYGFDRVDGLRETGDPRDMPFWFSASDFRVDRCAVQARLKNAQYIVGNIADTLDKFFEGRPAPIGFVSIDVDYYNSATDCFRVFEMACKSRLPRVMCYLDDIFGISDLTIIGDCLGELAAVHDWNAAHSEAPIKQVLGLRSKRAFPRYWNDQYYCFHDLKHPEYNRFVRA
jgi:hypothetical protein